MSPASDPKSVAAFLAACSAAFAELGVRWYLFGAQAAFFYGASRLTVDVDVTVALEGGSARDLVTALARHEVRSRVEDGAFIEQSRVLPVVHVPSRIAGDIVLAGPGLEERFLARARARDVLGVRVPVAAAEDLVVMKVLAGRPKDLEDVKSIVAAQGGKLDVEEVRGTLQLVEEALGQSDLVPAFEGILAAARASKRRRPKRERGAG
jgi:hypothetical protein